MCQSTGPVLCCLFLLVYVISNHQSTSKKPCHVLDLSILDALLHETHQGPSGAKVRKLNILSKITHQMLRKHPFSQKNKKNKAIKKAGEGEGG